MDMLKLVALDTDDLEVVSTHVQDSIVKVDDILWRPAEKRVVVVVNRFDWENAQSGAQYRRTYSDGSSITSVRRTAREVRR